MRKFRTSFSGYNKDDVNEFVSEVIREYESILQKLRSSTKEMEMLNRELERYKALEKSMNDTLLVAQEVSANAQKAAIAEGKLIVEDAKNSASKIVNNSLIKAQNIEREAEELKRKVISYKRRFIALVESQMDDVNKFDDRL
ncbi:MAG: DivIVA domain-containing protein [Firmicutes bacterium]|nr:DivIVA domain-containing protein [Bacillota bacterium]